MTINALHKLLGKMIAKGHGRRRVYIDKPSFEDCESGIVPVAGCGVAEVLSVDASGDVRETKAGLDVEVPVAVLYGDAGEA